jgi:hypothetical protein
MKKIINIFIILGVALVLSGCDSTSASSIEDLLIDEVDNSYTNEEISQEIDETIEDIALDSIVFDDFYEDYASDAYVLVEDTGDTYTIEQAGTYVFRGTYTMQVIVDVLDEDVVLVLEDADMTYEDGPVILVLDADDVTISLPSGTESWITDGSNYDESLDYNAAIYSTCDLIINGYGTLNIDANYNNGINTKDDLTILSTTLNITSVDDGIIGRDSISALDVSITLDVEGDGLLATNDESEDKGFIYLSSGTYTINAVNDGIQAVNSIVIENGTYTITSNDKGIVSSGDIIIGNGSFDIYSFDDAINSDYGVIIYDGDFTIATSDDGIHGNSSVSIYGGDILISQSYEGIEANTLLFDGGNIVVHASDDGINGSSATISGSLIQIDSYGDGIDINGSITMSAGYLIVFGPIVDMEGPIDYDQTFTLTGGLVVAIGSSGMAQAPSTSSTQASILYGLDSSGSAGDVIVLYDDEGSVLFEFEAIKTYASIVISVPSLSVGDVVTLEVDGDSEEITITSMVTSVGSVGGMDGGFHPPRR